MQSFYEKILNKPKSYRRKLSYIITALFGVIIFTIWLASITISMKESFNLTEEAEESNEKISNEIKTPSFEEEMKSFESIKENIKNQTEQLGNNNFQEENSQNQESNNIE